MSEAEGKRMNWRRSMRKSISVIRRFSLLLRVGGPNFGLGQGCISELFVDMNGSISPRLARLCRLTEEPICTYLVQCLQLQGHSPPGRMPHKLALCLGESAKLDVPFKSWVPNRASSFKLGPLTLF